METFGGLLALAAILLFVACSIGLIAPRLLKNPKTGSIPKRKHLAIVGLVAPLVMFAIGGSMLPKPEQDANAQEQVKIFKGTIEQTMDAMSDFSSENQTFEVLSQDPLHIRMAPEILASETAESIDFELKRAVIYGVYRTFIHTGHDAVEVTAQPMLITLNPRTHKLLDSPVAKVKITRQQALEVAKNQLGITDFDELVGGTTPDSWSEKMLNGRYNERTPGLQKFSQALGVTYSTKGSTIQTAQQSLGMTAQEFQKRFNATASNAGADIKIKSLNVQAKPGGVNDTFMHTAGNGYLVGVIDRQSKQLTALNMGLASGEGAADGLILLGVALNASTDGADASAIGKALSSLMSKAMADIEKPNAKPHEMRVGNRTYSASANKTVGLMLFVTPAQ